MAYRLVIGNKNTSSWSLRPWLAMRHAGIAFGEINIDLRAPDAKAQILRHSPSGKVPALLVRGRVIWDSLAILEFLAETHPTPHCGPRSRRRARWRGPRVGGDALGLPGPARALPDGLPRRARRRRACPSRWRPMCGASWPSGRTAAAGTALADRSCSGASRRPMPCTRRSRPGSAPTCPISPPTATTGTAQAYVECPVRAARDDRMGAGARRRRRAWPERPTVIKR